MDIAVTVAEKDWGEWERSSPVAGDLAPPQGTEYRLSLGHRKPARAEPGDRCYVFRSTTLRSYATVERIEYVHRLSLYYVVLRGAVVPVALPRNVDRFHRWRYRWWGRDMERRPIPR